MAPASCCCHLALARARYRIPLYHCCASQGQAYPLDVCTGSVLCIELHLGQCAIRKFGFQGRFVGGVQRPATADASLLVGTEPSGFAGAKPVWRQSSVAAAVERRLRPVSSSGEDEVEIGSTACIGAAEGGPEPGPPVGTGARGRDSVAAPEPCSSRRVGDGNKGLDGGLGFAPTPSAGLITAGGCAPTRRSARLRPRVETEVGASTGCHMLTPTAACNGTGSLGMVDLRLVRFRIYQNAARSSAASGNLWMPGANEASTLCRQQLRH